MQHTKATFRNARPEDISNIMKIEHASFADVICEEEDVFMERIKTFPDGFRIMEYNGDIAGYICSELWDKAEVLTAELFTLGHSIEARHKKDGSELYISSMGLNPKYRNLGLGKVMFNEFLKHADNRFEHIKSIILLVSENWTNARRIYKGSGFQELCVLPGFFHYSSNPLYCQDGIIMRKLLK